MKVRFVIPGEVKGKGRPRVTMRGGFARAYTPKDTVIYENLVRLEYQQQCNDYRFPDDSMLDMRIVAFYSIPRSASKKKRKMMERGEIRPTRKPDLDNAIKGIADAISGIAYKDDVQIVDCQIRKFYSDNPRTVVTIQEVKNE